MISVLMLTYNQDQYLREAIRGVLRQSFTDFELIIMDDCSTDNTMGVISEFRDDRLTHIRTPQRVGMMTNFYRGISHCDREYIAICDGDDFWTDKDKLRDDMLAFKKGIDMVHSHFIDMKGDKVYTNIPDFKEGCYSSKELLKGNRVCASSAVIRSSVAKKTILKQHWKMADYPLWLNCKNIYYRDQITTVHRLGGVSSGNFRQRLEFIRSANEIRQRYGGKKLYKPKIRLLLSCLKNSLR